MLNEKEKVKEIYKKLQSSEFKLSNAIQENVRLFFLKKDLDLVLKNETKNLSQKYIDKILKRYINEYSSEQKKAIKKLLDNSIV